MALSQSSGFTLYSLIRNRFDQLGDSISDQEEALCLISTTHDMSKEFQLAGDTANGLQFAILARDMEKDLTILPQPPTSCVTKQEWLKRVASERP